jgi:hypothetical protein
MQCPGQDSRYWGPEAISEVNCPNCGGVLEFFKDESSRKCRKCGVKVLNPKMDFGCAAYCKFASQCLGADMPPELLAKRTDLLKDRVAAEVKKFLGRDFKRIGRALKVVEYAGKIQKSEGGDPAIVTLAACLSAISSGQQDALPGAFSADDIEAAQSILSRTGAPDEPAREVISILKQLGGTDRSHDSANLKCVFDAITIAELIETLKTGLPVGDDQFDNGTSFLTDTGRDIIKKLLDEATGKKV